MKAFLALICSLGLACMGPPTAYAEGQKNQQQKNQQQKRAPPYTGHAAAYHGAVRGADHINVPANGSPLTGKPMQTGKRTPVGKAGNRANQHKAEPALQAVSTSAHRKAVIRSRTESTISKNREHQTLQAPMGLPIAGLPKWNFPTKSKPDVMLTAAAAVSASVPAQNLFVAPRGIPSRLVTLAPMAPVSSTFFEPKFDLPAFTVPSPNIPPGPYKPFLVQPGHPSGNPANPGTVPMPRIIPGQTHPAGPGDSSGNPANGMSTMSSNQPVNMANNPPPTAPTSGPRNVVNAQGTGERAPAGQFQQNRRIQGSDQWMDSDYDVFRNYRSEWHDRDWWRTHQSRIVYCVDGWYYWNGGYWFPAWGYDPEADYAYDGPIYAYKDWPPDQVTANVQGTLQKQGYYQGESNGLLGPPTSAALVDYQRTHGLYETSTIDRPTSQSLGMK